MQTVTHLKTLFSSFTIKLFVWFWLIAIISILTTRFISHQLSNEAFNTVKVQKSTPEELHQLHKAIQKINRSNITDVADLHTLITKRVKRKSMNVWLKSTSTNSRTQSFFPITVKHQQAIAGYINSQTFTQPQTHLFFHTNLIGPAEITINNEHYQAFISYKQRKRNFGQLVEELPTWALIAIPALISFVLCLLLARSFSKPIRAIKSATTAIGKGNLSTRVPVKQQSNDELSQLAFSFNQMAEQLQQHQSAQQRLLGDVSHELRSPMTRLQIALGLAQQAATTEQAKVAYLQRCQREIDRLDKMVADVLSLSRLENTLQSIAMEKININTLLVTIVNDEQFIANEKGIKIVVNHCADIYLNGDPALLISAISNVLSNAVKYGPEHSEITVHLSKTEQQLYITIDDAGHGVPEDALSQLFSPFYRVNLARDRKTGGTGLGLAIAKQAILAHQGKITAENRQTKASQQSHKNDISIIGLSVTIALPCL